MKNKEKLTKDEIWNKIANSIILEHTNKALKMKEFINSTKFNDILTTIISKNIFLDEENFRYFSNKVIDKFGIDGLTVEDISLFIECMSDDELIDSNITTIDKNILFENKTAQKLGLKVFTMYGQGTCIQIYPATMER